MIRFAGNLTALLAVIAVNALANILPLNGQNTGEISNRLNVLFTPAGYVFSIWSVIYVLLLVWVLRQLPRNRRDNPLYRTATAWFILSCLLNCAWIFAWHYEFFALSVAVMLGLLLTLIILYKRIKAVPHVWFDILPFSVYLGWISVATIANISYLLTYIGWNGWGLSDAAWTVIMLAVAALLALSFQIKQADRYYPLVFIWAFIGIAVRNQAAHASLVYVPLVLAIVLMLVAIGYRRNRRLTTP